MKKAKLLLFWLGLLFIWSFTQATDILYQGSYSCVASECQDNVIWFTATDIPLWTELCYEFWFISDNLSATYSYSYNFPSETEWFTYDWVWSYSNTICSSDWVSTIEYWIDFWSLDPLGDYNFTNYFKVYEYEPPFIPDLLLPWWQGSLEPVVEWLGSAIDEFIPYVVYVWLGVISIIIWFVAIKWLINRIRRNSLFVFSRKKKK